MCVCVNASKLTLLCWISLASPPPNLRNYSNLKDLLKGTQLEMQRLLQVVEDSRFREVS